MQLWNQDLETTPYIMITKKDKLHKETDTE